MMGTSKTIQYTRDPETIDSSEEVLDSSELEASSQSILTAIGIDTLMIKTSYKNFDNARFMYIPV